MRRLLTVTLAGAVLALGFAGKAGAWSTGIPDQARVGCASGSSCHATIVPHNLTTQLILQGLPDAGYTPGCTYHLQVWVLGIALPLTPPYDPIGGFNLEATGGSLAENPAVFLWPETDCQILARVENCTPSTPGSCTRSCDDVTLLDLQVTHRHRDPTDLTDQNRFTWSVDWTAPGAETSNVLFYLAGNLANGNGGRDEGDLWSVMSPKTVAENSGGSCP